MKICVLVKEVPDAAVEKRIDSVHQADRPQRREEPEPVRHPRHRGRHAGEGGRRGGGRGGRGGDDGPGVRVPRAAQGRLAGRRPLGPPHRRGPGRLRLLRHRLRAGQGARGREPRPGAAGPAVGRRRVLHDGRHRGRPPEDALAHPGDQDGRGGGQAHLRAPGRVRLRHGRGRPARRDLGGRRDQRAALPVAQGDHGREEEAARHQGDRRRGDRGRQGRLRRLAHRVLAINPPPEKAAGEIIEDEDTNETVEKIVAWLDERKLLA